MSTLDIHKRRIKSMAIIYTLISVLCILGNWLYEYLNYGAYIIYMRRLFLIPFLAGTVVSLFILLLHKSKFVKEFSLYLWNIGIIFFMTGALIKIFMQISSIMSESDRKYYIAGTTFFVCSLFWSVFEVMREKLMK